MDTKRFAQHLLYTKHRLQMTTPTFAAYLGSSEHTVKKWLTGEREPAAAVVRLVEVLGIIEAMAPGIHEALLPAPVALVKKVKQPTAKIETSENEDAENIL
jgi:predicted transcriptional regulator